MERHRWFEAIWAASHEFLDGGVDAYLGVFAEFIEELLAWTS